ncbi:TPA_asm: hypothetical protein [ssRNA phage Zoerhiza.1_3]|uniref:Uncharacterized protein n=2 Tax=Leviviricetes TaxID=2842243 RepID=A0A8S5KZ80_9VIRU|nr:hypothetical protein QIO25_gp3 [ssRNA phage Zoerhiza.1_3]QDH87931.1 MAG: hypothetical protein H1Rhizo25438_000003 [Leviviridae sp.]DAD50500.1 TPA_asm: hypothetical protein [ssRNA phage Zoerhiza.1_3]
MRSSPRFLVASRSGEDGEHLSDQSNPEGPDQSVVARRLERPESGDGAEVSVRLKVGYKTVLLVVVVFDFVHLSFREIVNTSWFEHLLLGLGT